MGERFPENWRITAATLFSVALVAGAYMLARNIELPTVAEASEETALLQAIATKDSDNDGLPDWEETLYGTDAHTLDSFKLGMTDGVAVSKGLIVPKAIAEVTVATSTPATDPGTITDAFAKNFFMQYLAAKQINGGIELSSEQTNALADQTITKLSQDFAPAAPYKKAADLEVSGEGVDALRAFAVAAEAVLKKNATDVTKSEMGYFQDVVENSDASAVAHLASLSSAYRNTAVGLAVLPVPKELAAADLTIVNAIMRLSEIDNDFARVNSDPIAAMLALQQFRETELAAEHAFAALASVYAASGITFQNGTPGASFVNLMANLGANQKTGAQTP
ncbi:MAG: hypothetical protein PHV99_02925 [Candidatus Pacebacteria bacterium]|nr:hypothetical protein [Candidatus Paceibacterota bacterium]